MIVLYVHRKTVRYLDYGDLLDTERGIAWSTSNDPSLAIGFERDVTVADAIKRFEGVDGIGSVFVLKEGVPIERSHDMNPHGLI